MKNESKSDLKEVSLTLHPATQYINNYPREFLIRDILPWRLTTMASSTQHFNDHLDFFTSKTTPITITSNWIRIGLIAGKVSNEVHSLCEVLWDDSNDILVIGSLNHEKWLSSHFRSSYVCNT